MKKKCVRCDNPSRPNRIHCQACADFQKKYQAKRRRECLSAGLCQICGHRDICARSKNLCEECLESQIKANNKRRSGLKAKGLCVECGKKPASKGVLRCRPCQDKVNARARGRDPRKQREANRRHRAKLKKQALADGKIQP